MPSDIRIGVAADTRDFASSVKRDVEGALEDVSDALDDVAKDSDKAGEKLEDSLRDASKATEKVERSYKDLADTAKRETREAGNATRKNIDDGADAAKASMQEVKAEAISNASETFSSFDGSASGLMDGIQGTFGGLVSSLGPLGMALGAAGAVGIGLISAALVESEEEAERTKERISQIAQELIDAGEDGSVSLGYISDELREMATSTEDGSVSLSKLRQEAKELGVPFRELAQYYASGEGDIGAYIAKVEDLIDAEKLRLDQVSGSANPTSKQLQSLEATRDAMKQVAEATSEARQQEEDYIASGGPELEAKADSIAALRDSVVDSLGDAAEGWDQFYDAATGALNIDKYIEAYAARVAGIERYNENLTAASETLSSEALDYIRSLGVEAAPLLDAYVNAPASKKADIERIWAANGKAAADGYAKELEANIPSEVKGPKVKLDTSGWASQVTNAVNAAINASKGKKVVIPIEQQYTTKGTKVF